MDSGQPGLETKTRTGIGTGNQLSGGSHTVIYGKDIPGWENYGKNKPVQVTVDVRVVKTQRSQAFNMEPY